MEACRNSEEVATCPLCVASNRREGDVVALASVFVNSEGMLSWKTSILTGWTAIVL